MRFEEICPMKKAFVEKTISSSTDIIPEFQYQYWNSQIESDSLRIVFLIPWYSDLQLCLQTGTCVNETRRVLRSREWAALSYFGSTALPLICLTLKPEQCQSAHTHRRTLHHRTEVWTRGNGFLLHVTMHWLLAGCCGLALIHLSGKCQLQQYDQMNRKRQQSNPTNYYRF